MVAKPRKDAKALYDAISRLTGFYDWNDEKLCLYAQDQVRSFGNTALYAGIIQWEETRRDVFVGKSNL